MNDIIEAIGHDGSEILWDHLDEPKKRRGFHFQEIIIYCLQYNIPCWPLWSTQVVQSCDQGDPHEYEVNIVENLDDIKHAVIAGPLLNGMRHAVAKVREIYYDPSTGLKYLTCPVTPEMVLVINC